MQALSASWPDVDGLFVQERKSNVGLRVYTKAIEVARGSWSSCVHSAYSVSGYARGCRFAVASVWVGLVIEHGSKAKLESVS